MAHVINRVRARHDRAPLRTSPSLVASARRYGTFMLVHDFFGHLSRIRASRAFNQLGEALAYHPGWRPGIRATVNRWLRSPSHRRLVLARSYRYLGAARRKGRFGRARTSVWVLHLGRR